MFLATSLLLPDEKVMTKKNDTEICAVNTGPMPEFRSARTASFEKVYNAIWLKREGPEPGRVNSRTNA
jgi:hypothetical protein